jgi:hypothetical protein
MDKTILLVASGTMEGGLIFSYQRAFEALGWRVEQFDMEKARLAALPKPAALGSFMNRVMGHIDVHSVTQKANRELVMAAIRKRPGMILITANEPVRPATLIELKVALPETKIVNIFPDTLFNLRDHVIAGLPIYDAFCAHTKAGIAQLERLGCRGALYVPLAADPGLHYPMPLTAEEQRTFGCDVVYVGNWRPEHEELFSHLEGFDLAIWGSVRWNNAKPGSFVRSRWRGRALFAKDFAKAHLGAKVCLNPVDPLNFPGHNQRFFELPACRVFSLVTRTEDTTSILREGETVATFASPEELVQKVRHYLAHAEERDRIASAAYELVINGGHTYKDRARMILDRLGLPA